MDSNKKVVYVNDDDNEQSDNEQSDNEEVYESENKDLNEVNDNTEEYELSMTKNESIGGDDVQSISDISEVATEEIFKIDPMYLRLTKFLQTNDGENVADMLKKVSIQLENLNANLSQFVKNNSN